MVYSYQCTNIHLFGSIYIHYHDKKSFFNQIKPFKGQSIKTSTEKKQNIWFYKVNESIIWTNLNLHELTSPQSQSHLMGHKNSGILSEVCHHNHLTKNKVKYIWLYWLIKFKSFLWCQELHQWLTDTKSLINSISLSRKDPPKRRSWPLIC